MPKSPRTKSTQRTSLKQTRELVHRVLDNIQECDGVIADEYIEWVRDRLHEPKDPIKQLFDRAGLNPGEPKHWVALLSYVVEAIYTERRGAPVVWNSKENDRLLKAAYRMHINAKRKGQIISKKEICDALQSNSRLGVLKSGTYVGSLRSKRTLLRELERALTRVEGEFVYPARRNDLEGVPKLRKTYELWLDTFRPAWRDRLNSDKRNDLRKNIAK